MKLSAPVHILKQQAKALSRKMNVPLHQALNQIARQEGFEAWSLLSAKVNSGTHGAALAAQLCAGDLVLVASLPGQGKTRLGIDVAIHAMRQGNRAAFFTLYCTRADVADLFKAAGGALHEFPGRLMVDDSDQICARYVAEKLASAPANTLVVIDYLQLLDENRSKPDLESQVQQLRTVARDRKLIILCLAQIDRSFDAADRSCPGIDDVRLPNPVDLGLFDRTCFLNRGRMQTRSSA